jgi:hypothetical protein
VLQTARRDLSYKLKHAAMGRYTGKKCRLVSMCFLTSTFFLVEIVVGHVTNSMALGSILQNSISAENLSNKFSSTNI